MTYSSHQIANLSDWPKIVKIPMAWSPKFGFLVCFFTTAFFSTRCWFARKRGLSFWPLVLGNHRRAYIFWSFLWLTRSNTHQRRTLHLNHVFRTFQLRRSSFCRYWTKLRFCHLSPILPHTPCSAIFQYYSDRSSDSQLGLSSSLNELYKPWELVFADVFWLCTFWRKAIISICEYGFDVSTK